MIREYDLSGEWLFSLNEPTLEDHISLPGTTAQAGKGVRNTKREIGMLTEVYPFEGCAYYEKKVSIALEELGKELYLSLERTRKTRVWVDGRLAGAQDSLYAPHVYRLTEAVNSPDFLLRIEVENTNYPSKGGHMTSPDTQTNWNGITGKLALMVYDTVSIRGVRAEGHVDTKEAKFQLEVVNNGPAVETTLTIQPREWSMENRNEEESWKEFSPLQIPLSIPEGESRITAVYPFREEPVLWSEYTPVLYRFRFTLEGSRDAAQTDMGMRSFQAGEHAFLINGRQTMLRGKHEGLAFPLTGAAPTDVEEWLRVMGISKSYGMNHYRCHTCCPPEAAFTAADLLGIYLEPELPFWGTIAEEGEEQYNGEEQEFLIQEGLRILRAFGNHPSFCMLSMGNELWGSPKRIGEMMRRLKEADSRPLYTQGSNNFQFVPTILPEEDFFVGVRLDGRDADGNIKRLIRGSYAMCDAPQGHVQTTEPSTRKNYDEEICPVSAADAADGAAGGEIEIQFGTGVKKVKAADGAQALIPHVPVVSHEIGQYATYPNFHEIPKFTGVTRAENLKIFRERLVEKGMGDQADDFFFNSGKLAVQCYKEELEAMHRTRNMAGYQILDLQDFQGQGTALVGILDVFMDSKGLVGGEEWRSFCSDEVLLAEFDRYNYMEGERFQADVKISYFNQSRELVGREVVWELVETEGKEASAQKGQPGTDPAGPSGEGREPVQSAGKADDQRILYRGILPIPDHAYGLTELGSICAVLPMTEEGRTKRLTLRMRAEGTSLNKEYPLWIYPAKKQVSLPEKGGCVEGYGEPVWVAVNAEQASAWLQEGKRVLYLPARVKESVEGTYCTDFWNYPMFRSISESMGKPVPVGTMGLLIQNDHPALAGFGAETFTTPQWYAVCSDCDCAVLEEKTAPSMRPIVQMIDNFERNHKLGVLWEAAVGEGKLLVCTSRLQRHMDRPEIRQLVHSLLRYAGSPQFAPEEKMELGGVEEL